MLRWDSLLWGSCLAHLICCWFHLFVLVAKVISFFRCGFSESRSTVFCNCHSLCFIFFCYFTVTLVYSYLHRAGVRHSSAAPSPYICLHWSVFCLTYWWHYWKVLWLLLQLQHSSVPWFSVVVSVGVFSSHTGSSGFWVVGIVIDWFYYVIHVFSSV